MEWLLGVDWVDVSVKALAIVGAASVLVKTIAPLTKWTGDDKVAAFLEKLSRVLGKIALNPPSDK